MLQKALEVAEAEVAKLRAEALVEVAASRKEVLAREQDGGSKARALQLEIERMSGEASGAQALAAAAELAKTEALVELAVWKSGDAVKAIRGEAEARVEALLLEV